MEATIESKATNQSGQNRAAASITKKKARDPNAISSKTNFLINLFFILYSCACLLPVLHLDAADDVGSRSVPQP